MKKLFGRMKRLTTLVLAVALLLSLEVPARAETFSAIVAVDAMAVYSEPTLSQKLGTLKRNAVVRVTAYAGGIARITQNGYTGYARVSDMKAVDAVAEKAVLNASAPVYQTADAKGRSVRIGKGTQVYVLATSGGWAQVEKGGIVGYIDAQYLTMTDAAWNPVLIATPTPTAAPTPAASPAPGDGEAVKAVVSAASLTVYRSASTESARLGVLQKGRAVNVLKWNSQWAYIELNGKYGFCAVKGLAREGDVATPAPTASPAVGDAVKAVVSAASVNVYDSASDSAVSLGALKKGREVNVVGWTGEWAYIELGGKYGYCKLSALARKDSANKLPLGFREGGFTATAVDPGARAYASASTAANSVKLTLGATVNVYAYSEDWACIVQGGSYGFVPVKQLSRASYDAISSDGAALQTLLKALLSYGYFDGMPSSLYNTAAITAIKRFQSACGLAETGVADQALQRILYGGYAPASGLLSATLTKGDTGANVARVQARLFALGYLSKSGSLDGDYGSNTVSAVKLFQSANGLTASGTADPATLRVLYSTGANGLPSGSSAADIVVTPTTTVKPSSTYMDSVPSGLASSVSSYHSGMSIAEKLEYVVYLAQNQLGKPYVYGAAGPDKYDCSGLTTYCYKQIGISLKRSAYAQGYDETYPKIESVADLRRGDLVFFNTISDSDLSDHAGVYLGSGYFIHASSGGHRVVVSNLTTGYYSRVYSWGRRVLN